MWMIFMAVAAPNLNAHFAGALPPDHVYSTHHVDSQLGMLLLAHTEE